MALALGYHGENTVIGREYFGKHPVSNAETMPWEDRRPRPITKADLL